MGLWLLGLGIDQLTKLWALAELEVGDSTELIPRLLRLTLIFNPGAAFGMGESATLIFTIFAIVATLACLFIFLPRVTKAWQAIALGLLLAGITGNLVDRLFQPPAAFHGHVVDFLQVPGFAIFNFADMCITVGAGLVILASFFDKPEEAEEAASA